MGRSKTYHLSQQAIELVDNLSNAEGRKKNAIIERAVLAYSVMDESIAERLIKSANKKITKS